MTIISRELLDMHFVSTVEEYLTEKYGATRKSSTGVHWLMGRDEYSSGPGTGCLDHLEYRYKDGYHTVVGRPYGLSMAGIEELVALAKKKNAELYIQCPSNYNSSTLLVIITDKPARWD